MPASFEGTKEQRLADLERRGQRCDGAHRFCTQAATSQYLVVPVEPGTGKDKAGAEPFVLRGCSKHKRRFGDDPMHYRVLKAQDIPRGRMSPEARRASTERMIRMKDLIGRWFIAAEGDPIRRVAGVRYVVDDVRLRDDDGNYFMLRDVFQLNPHTRLPDDDEIDVEDRDIPVPLAIRFSH